MGIFLSLSGVINKDPQAVEASVKKFTEVVKGGFQRANIADDHPNLAVMGIHGSNTALVYPNYFEEWDAASAFISKDLNATVFSLHIHDEDLWMFQMYHNGENITRFNPLPDYWEEDITTEEVNYWLGDADLISQYIPGLEPASIQKYLRRWDWDEEGEEKAYPEDEFGFGDCWQVVDFMAKVGLEYPIDETGILLGKKYKLWTSQLDLEQ
jgi:hypothetical protein